MSWQRVSDQAEIAASAEEVFDLLADARKHALLDGSASVKGVVEAPERLFLGARFRMSMKIGVPYRMTNLVVEFDEGRLIAWRHFGRHIWRYEIEPLEAGHCRVTETFDYEHARSPLLYEVMHIPEKNLTSIRATLLNLQLHFSS
ncbi:MAG: SRPBCC family protein [Actinomycetota bacterium]|nr:SRPBCC family protein [Actinomycetota bacterium]